jgi:membrane fusion protein
LSIKAEKLPRFTDISWRWIAYCSSSILALGLVFTFFQEIELKRDVPCEVVSRSEIKIKGLTGLVTELYVRPGQQIQQGQPLFQLARDLALSSDGTPRPKFDENLRDEQLATAKAQYVDRVAALAAKQQASERAETARRDELRVLAQQQVRVQRMASDARQVLARLEGMQAYVTADRVEQARHQANQSEVEVTQGVARQKSLQGEIETLRGDQHQLQVQQSEMGSQYAREVQDIRLRFESARQNNTVFAPQGGVVTFSNVVAGHSLELEDIALVIATGSKQPLEAALTIPSRQRGFIREGQMVRIKLDAYPYARFGTLAASIESISDTAMSKTESTSPPSSPPQPESSNYMAWAHLSTDAFGPAGRPLHILPGMRGTASVVIERRTIAEWVLEPLFQMIRG